MPRVVLTFDDGPGPSTPALLDVLAAANVKAVFFVLGANLELRRDVAVRMAREGHELGNHTYSHARPGALDAPAFAAELARTDALIEAVLRDAGIAGTGALIEDVMRDATVARADGGVPRDVGDGARPRIRVRLPYGAVGDDPRVPMLAALGRAHVGWTADFEDWLDDRDPREIAARMRAHVDAQHARGHDAVLDLHDSSRLRAAREHTVEAVRYYLGSMS